MLLRLRRQERPRGSLVSFGRVLETASTKINRISRGLRQRVGGSAIARPRPPTSCAQSAVVELGALAVLILLASLTTNLFRILVTACWSHVTLSDVEQRLTVPSQSSYISRLCLDTSPGCGSTGTLEGCYRHTHTTYVSRTRKCAVIWVCGRSGLCRLGRRQLVVQRANVFIGSLHRQNATRADRQLG